jgi:hypothetical protein
MKRSAFCREYLPKDGQFLSIYVVANADIS